MCAVYFPATGIRRARYRAQHYAAIRARRARVVTHVLRDRAARSLYESLPLSGRRLARPNLVRSRSLAPDSAGGSLTFLTRRTCGARPDKMHLQNWSYLYDGVFIANATPMLITWNIAPVRVMFYLLRKERGEEINLYVWLARWMKYLLRWKKKKISAK